ncbi:MAG: peptidase S14 [Sphingobium sp.]|jgi:ATP-dependent protease ClpP protease subunit|uniref:Peptidase S14 n=1 Tax=Sphingobium xenophagum TaxID=121428 RepID=A0A249MRE4_SPHXE|nr:MULTISPECIES: peptidase S14 [Sphingobium]MBU0658112.1 peptidase S14 [Alphaproteobacteria bacterium]ASY43862.1 peptidase S14 [Sphingobium xenophagum]MBA4756040.1 peptidase S14 [Sphingobium sp.]MBS89716.1 peptidase S14 [Sphingobium sp.]MBU0774753.1 peptidase S14 [Alphaproteobacteria bacterium]
MLMTAPMLGPKDFEYPSIMLSGVVDHGMYLHFKNCLSNAPQQGLVVVEISTLGGDPEIARLMGEDIRFHSDLYPERRLVFLGRTAVYSAGATFMSFFATENRYVTRGTRIMIHERLITKNIQLSGPLSTCIATLKATLNEIESSIAIQNEGFQNLILGSDISMEELLQKAPENWYLEANEAQARGLIAAVL